MDEAWSAIQAGEHLMEVIGVLGASMLELHGYAREEMIAMDVQTITVDPPQRAQVQSAIAAAGR